jgi:hypothetical protein
VNVYWFCGKFWYFAENSGKFAENSGMDTMSRCHLKRRNLPGNRSKKHVCHTPTLYGGRLIHRMPQTIRQWFMQIKCILYAHYLHTTGALCTLGWSVQTVVVTNPTQTFAGSKGTICLSGLATMPTDPESFDLQIVGAW